MLEQSISTSKNCERFKKVNLIVVKYHHLPCISASCAFLYIKNITGILGNVLMLKKNQIWTASHFYQLVHLLFYAWRNPYVYRLTYTWCMRAICSCICCQLRQVYNETNKSKHNVCSISKLCIFLCKWLIWLWS